MIIAGLILGAVLLILGVVTAVKILWILGIVVIIVVGVAALLMMSGHARSRRRAP